MKQFLFFIIILFLYTSVLHSQAKGTIYHKIPNLDKDLALLSAYPYGFDDVDTESLNLDSSVVKNYSIGNFDIDSLINVVTQKMITYLKKQDIRNIIWTDIPCNVDIKADISETFHVLDFGYNSGGSAGYISQPIIIREINDSLQFYDIKNLESPFVEFYPLYDNTYLCISNTRGRGWCPFQSIYGINFNGIEAKLIPIFGNRSNIDICWSEVTFDSKKKYLTINIVGDIQFTEGKNCETYFNQDTNNCFLITNCDFDEESIHRATLTTLFDGKKFVNP